MIEIRLNPDLPPAKDNLPTLCAYLQNQISVGKYFFKKNTHSEFESTIIKFDSDVICRPVPNEGGYYCHFIGQQLGDGAFGVVYGIAERVFLSSVEFKTVNYAEEQVVKIQDHCDCQGSVADKSCDHHHSKAMLDLLTGFAPRLTHLQLLPPLYDPEIKTSYSFMRHIPQQELYELLVERGGKLNLMTRFELCLSLLKAIKAQVTDKKLIHRDLKPENVIVDLSSEPIMVNIIDYGLAIDVPVGEFGILASRRVGTMCYLSPEAFKPKTSHLQLYWHSYKMDVFAAGRMLVEILRGPDKSYHKNCGEHDYQDYLDHDLLALDDLYFYLDKLAFSQKQQLKRLVTSMLELEESKRCTIEYAIKQFEPLVLSVNAQLSSLELCSSPDMNWYFDYKTCDARAAEFLVDDLLYDHISEKSDSSDQALDDGTMPSPLGLMSPIRVLSKEPSFSPIREDEDEEEAGKQQISFEQRIFKPIHPVFSADTLQHRLFPPPKKLERPWTTLPNISELPDEYEVTRQQSNRRFVFESALGTETKVTPAMS